MAGKPHAPIYDLSFASAAANLARPIDKRRVLAIGDGVQTDLLGANRQGLDALFIAAGVNGNLNLGGSAAPDMATVQRLLDAGVASARYVMAALAW